MPRKQQIFIFENIKHARMKASYLPGIIFMLAVGTTNLQGQFYSTGEAPAAINWNRIRTPHFTLLFPKGFDRDASSLANRLEYYKTKTESDLHYTVKKFPVVLYNTSVLSNGYVTLAPKRMELVPASPQDGYAQEWFTQLALHEYRHVVQLSKFNQGFTRVLSWFTGEIGTGAVASMIPRWFYEGDAVYNETRLSAAGRGRIPGFEMPLRTILLDQSRTYSYDKAVFGSYRDFVPNHYLYGYKMVSHAVTQYGDDVWSEAIRYTAGHPYFFWPLAFYLKKNFGVYKSELYAQTIDTLKTHYIRQEDTVTFINYAIRNCRNTNVFASYTLPKDAGHGKWIALKTGLDEPASFVSIDTTGKEKQLFITGYTTGLKCDIHDERLVWDEIHSDPRWAQSNFSILRTYDISTGKQRTITARTRYFSPDYSPDGNRIAVAETDPDNKNYITVLDAYSGKNLLRFPTPQNKAVQFPEWISLTEIVAITVSDLGKQLEKINLEQGKWESLFPVTRLDISEPINYKNYILIRGSFKGIENIYAISKSDPLSVFQVTFSRFGAYHPAVSDDSTQLLFSSYSGMGFDVTSIPLDSSLWQPIQFTAPAAEVRDSLPAVVYQAERYRRAGHVFNIHSWTPFYFDPEELTVSVQDARLYPGVMLFSQNLLSTVISRIGYRYNEGNHEFIPAITWRGLYPAVELSGTFGGLAEEIHLKTYLPLTYNRGKNITQVQPQLEYEHSGTVYPEDEGYHTGIDYLHYKVYLYHYLRPGYRDLFPKWGQYVFAAFTHTPEASDAFGTMLSLQAGLYLPGIFPHHHVIAMSGYQIQFKGDLFIPLNRVIFPRGYHSSVSREFTSVLLNYSFPAGYPDLSLGPLLYLKRIRVNLFHDWSYGKEIRVSDETGTGTFTGNYRSYGTEIVADTHIFRIIFPIAAGIRLGYIPGKQKFFSELMFSIDTGAL
jgi:hypothetical protein